MYREGGDFANFVAFSEYMNFKTLLGDVNKLFVSKRLVTNNVLLLHLNHLFLAINWIYTECEGDGIEFRLPFKIFSNLKVPKYSKVSAQTLLILLSINNSIASINLYALNRVELNFKGRLTRFFWLLTTDYGRPTKPFFIEIQNFWADTLGR